MYCINVFKTANAYHFHPINKCILSFIISLS